MHKGMRSILFLCLIASCAPRGRAKFPIKRKQLAQTFSSNSLKSTQRFRRNARPAAEAMARRLRDGGSPRPISN